MPATSDLLPLLIHEFLYNGAVWGPFIDAPDPLSVRACAPDFAGTGTRGAALVLMTVPSPMPGRCFF